MILKDAAPKPAHDAPTVFGLTDRAHYLIDKFLALPPSQRALATDLLDEFASLVEELKTLRVRDVHDKN